MTEAATAVAHRGIRPAGDCGHKIQACVPKLSRSPRLKEPVLSTDLRALSASRMRRAR